MGIGILKNARLYIDELDLSGLANETGLDYGAKELEATVLNSVAEEVTAGLVKFGLNCKGFTELGTGKQDELSFAQVGALALASVHVTGTEGDRAWFGQLLQSSYSPGGKVGDLQAFTVKGAGSGLLCRGNSLAIGQKSANGSGSVFQLGALTASQTLYAGLHVIQYAGLTSISVKVQSAALVGFGTPHDQITFTLATGVTSELKSLAGANTDTYWRANWTVVGTGTATIVVVMAIV